MSYSVKTLFRVLIRLSQYRPPQRPPQCVLNVAISALASSRKAGEPASSLGSVCNHFPKTKDKPWHIISHVKESNNLEGFDAVNIKIKH